MMDRMMRNFNQVFAAPLTEREQERADYTRHVREIANDPLGGPIPTIEEWRAKQAARGNREGQNHD